MASNETNFVPPSQRGITLLTVRDRTFRIPTASLPPGYKGFNGSSKPTRPSKNHDDPHPSTPDPSQEDLSTLKIPVPSSLHGSLNRRNGAAFSHLHATNGAQIDLQTNLIILKAPSSNLTAASALLRTYFPPTHFISLPLTVPALQSRFESFKSEILSYNLPNVHESIFVKAQKLHITLGVCKLYGDEVAKALEGLKALREEVESFVKDGVEVEIEGAKVMENIGSANVVYADVKGVKELGGLYIAIFTLYLSFWGYSLLVDGLWFWEFAGLLNARLIELGIVEKENRPLKPHMTLINTKYRSGASGVSRHHQPPRISIDARPILKIYGTAKFGTVRIGQVQLARMKGVDSLGGYLSEGALVLA